MDREDCRRIERFIAPRPSPELSASFFSLLLLISQMLDIVKKSFSTSFLSTRLPRGGGEGFRWRLHSIDFQSDSVVSSQADTCCIEVNEIVILIVCVAGSNIQEFPHYLNLSRLGNDLDLLMWRYRSKEWSAPTQLVDNHYHLDLLSNDLDLIRLNHFSNSIFG